MLKKLFTFFVLFVISEASSQKTKVYGTITDSTFGEPLPGVIVKFKGTKMGTSSDVDGNYLLETYYASDTLEVSYPTLKHSCLQ